MVSICDTMEGQTTTYGIKALVVLARQEGSVRRITTPISGQKAVLAGDRLCVLGEGALIGWLFSQSLLVPLAIVGLGAACNGLVWWWRRRCQVKGSRSEPFQDVPRRLTRLVAAALTRIRGSRPAARLDELADLLKDREPQRARKALPRPGNDGRQHGWADQRIWRKADRRRGSPALSSGWPGARQAA